MINLDKNDVLTMLFEMYFNAYKSYSVETSKYYYEYLINELGLETVLVEVGIHSSFQFGALLEVMQGI